MHRTTTHPLRPGAEPSAVDHPSLPSVRGHGKLLIITGAILVTVIAAAIAFEHFWPFTPHALARHLQQHSSATIEFGSFRKLFFPHPGFVAERVVVRRTPSSAPGISINKLTVLATYSGLLGSTKSISLLKADGLLVNVFTGTTAQNLEFHKQDKHPEQLKLDQFVADDSVLQVGSADTAKPLVFRIARLRMNGLGDPNSAGHFDIALQNPLPTMQIAADGEFGPWRPDRVPLTPLSGSFSISGGSLEGLPSLHGTLTGAGWFKGKLEQLEVLGRADVAGFEVQSLDHPMPLDVRFDSTVDTRTAQVALRSIHARLADTDIDGSGVISPGSRSPAAISDLALRCEHGRVEDLLGLFTSSPKPSLTGPLQFQATASLERGNGPFLQRVRLDGAFVIPHAQFTSPVTQYKLDRLSARSQGAPREENPPEHAAYLSSQVDLSDGVARLSRTEFRVTGADATGGGTFNVLSDEVNLQGRVRMRAELSESSKGAKSIFLKLLDPFFKKRGAGAEVPVHVTGTSQHAHFRVGL